MPARVLRKIEANSRHRPLTAGDELGKVEPMQIVEDQVMTTLSVVIPALNEEA